MPRQGKWYISINEFAKAAKTMPLDEIASKFGVSKKTVMSDANKLGIEVETPYKATTNKLIKAINENPNATVKQLSEITGIPEKTIFARSNKKEITLPNSREVVELNYDQVKDLCSRMSITKIAETLGAGRRRVAVFIRSHGLKANSNWYNDGVQSGQLAHWIKSKPRKKAERKTVAVSKPKEKTAVIQIEQKIVWPEGIKVQVIKPKESDDPRCLMSKPVYKPSQWGNAVRY